MEIPWENEPKVHIKEGADSVRRDHRDTTYEAKNVSFRDDTPDLVYVKDDEGELLITVHVDDIEVS